MSEKAISKKKTVRFWTVEFSRCGSKRVAHRTEFFGIIHMYHLCGWQGDQLSFLHLLCTDLPFISKQVFSFSNRSLIFDKYWLHLSYGKPTLPPGLAKLCT